MIRVTLLAAMTMWGTSVFAQNGRICASHEHNLDLQKTNPEMISRMELIENHTQEFIANRKESRSSEDLITIPVVVHVIYNTESQNISDAQIQSQIAVLNEDFRKLNDNFSSTVSEFQDIAADFQIEFCLSSVDPDGKATNGINRKYSERASWGTGSAVKSSAQGGIDAWPTDQYLNMWVANIGGGILGYAQFPGGAETTDGVVMSPQYFGSIEKLRAGENFNLRAPFNLGRTATHEVGHWLNLRHIWGDGGCGFDDLVGDTPLSDRANYGCNTNHSSCNSLDNVQNFMDYTDDVCMTMFTKGQKERARALFSEDGFRYALRSSNGCGAVDTRCEAPQSITIDVLNDGTATVDFSSGINSGSYTIQILENSTEWKTVSTTTNEYFDLENLTECSTYDLRIISTCSDINQDTSEVVSFNTISEQCFSKTCETPTSLNVADQGGNTLFGNVLVSWDEKEEPEAYIYELRVTSLPFIKMIRRVSSNVNSITFGGLPKWWSYEIRLRSKCGDDLGYSEWTPFQTFAPGNNRQASEESGDITERFEYDQSAVFKVYPNPASNQVNLRFGAEFNNITVQLIDMTGKVSKAFSIDMQSNGVLSIDLSTTTPGMYFLNVRSEEIEILTQKVIVTK